MDAIIFELATAYARATSEQRSLRVRLIRLTIANHFNGKIEHRLISQLYAKMEHLSKCAQYSIPMFDDLLDQLEAHLGLE